MRRAVSALTGVAVNFAPAVTVGVPGSLLGRMTDGEVVRPALVAAQLVAVQNAPRGQQLEEQARLTRA